MLTAIRVETDTFENVRVVEVEMVSLGRVAISEIADMTIYFQGRQDGF